MARKSTKSAGERFDAYAHITAKMVAALESGTVPWRQPWRGGNAPRNAITGRRYSGINVLLLGLSGHRSPFWMTFKQIEERGGNVKGQKGTQIVFFKMQRVADRDNPGETKQIPLMRFYYVWNADQIQGEDFRPTKAMREAAERQGEVREPLAEAEAIIDGYGEAGPAWEADSTDGAYYIPSSDEIHVPPREDFPALEGFYATLFHEFGHSTGHKSRLDRGLSGGFGSHAYGREELVAEMTAAFLCAESGIENTGDNSAAYLASWIRTISEDTKAITWAAARAQKAADFILGHEPEDKSNGEEAAA